MRTVKLTSKETGESIIVPYDTIINPNIKNNYTIQDGTDVIFTAASIFILCSVSICSLSGK